MKSQKMKAVISTGYGGPDVLQIQTVDKPIPADNEVLVKVKATPVTTAGTMMRTGFPLIGRLFMGLTKPKNAISGTGFAGVIESVGANVNQFNSGDRVFGESLETFGTHAEYVTIKEDGIISIMPENLSYEEACVVGDGHITSLNFLQKIAAIQPGQHLVIIGASGSLGTAAVQLAKHFGATVTGICSTTNVEMVKKLGADFVIDYTHSDFTKNGDTYDVIYDTVGKSSFSKCKNSLTENGLFISPVLGFSTLIQMLRTSLFGKKKVLFSATGMLPVSTIRDFLKEIKELMSMKKLQSVIDKRYSLDQISDAHRYIDLGHKKGNVVLTI